MTNYKRPTQIIAQSNKERIIELRTIHPEMTLEAIGVEVALTKERVRQILAKEGLPTLSTGRTTTRSKPIKPCPQCGSFDKNFKTKHSLYCGNVCRQKGKKEAWIRWRNNHPERWTTFQCDYCGKEKTLRTSQYKRNSEVHKNMYCSRSCNITAQWANANSKMSNRHSKDGPNVLPLAYLPDIYRTKQVRSI